MDQHGAVIYADLLRYYGFDLVDLVSDTPTKTPSQTLALIENLPLDSKTVATLADTPSAVGWDTQAHLLAELINAVRENSFINMQVRTKKKLQPFDRVPIPGEAPKEKPVNQFVQMAQQALMQRSEDD